MNDIQTTTAKPNRIVRDEHGRYNIPRPGVTSDEILELAAQIAAEKLQNQVTISNPSEAKRIVQFHFGNPEHEQFAVLWLNTKHTVLGFDVLFYGTIDGASVYPRSVVKKALEHNAAAAILVHNHPSGITEPSDADLKLTERLKEALGLVDVRILDHFIIGHDVFSFAENCLI